MNKAITASFINMSQKCKAEQPTSCILTKNLRVGSYRRKSSALTSQNQQWWVGQNTPRMGSVGHPAAKVRKSSNHHSELSSRSMNVINLLQGSAGQQKGKPNGSKKITRTNLDKYFQYCLKKVESKYLLTPNKGAEYLQNSSQVNPQPQTPKPKTNIIVQKQTPRKLTSSWCLFNIKDKKQHKQVSKQNLSFFCRRPKSFHITQRKKSNLPQQITHNEPDYWHIDNLSGWNDSKGQLLQELMI